MKTKITKETFIEILKSIGLDQEQMKNFHREIEKRDPQFHTQLLHLLAISEQEIEQIRKI